MKSDHHLRSSIFNDDNHNSTKTKASPPSSKVKEKHTVVESVLNFLDPFQAPAYFDSNDGSLDLSKVHSHTILAKPIPTDARLDREGFTRIPNLRPFLLMDEQYSLTEWEANNDTNTMLSDSILRQAVDRFWKSSQGRELLQHYCVASEGQEEEVNDDDKNDDDDHNITVVTTHVTRRQAPPDNISFVHIDYPTTHSFSTLVQEHGYKWSSSMLPHDYDSRFHLEDVFTIWICLSSTLEDFPLFIAHKQSVPAQSIFIYPVVGGKTKKNKKKQQRHSVGVSSSSSLEWYHPFPMQQFDALVFDTRRCPHASAALLERKDNSNSNGNSNNSPSAIRKSAEIRCLILSSRNQKPKTVE